MHSILASGLIWLHLPGVHLKTLVIPNFGDKMLDTFDLCYEPVHDALVIPKRRDHRVCFYKILR